MAITTLTEIAKAGGTYVVGVSFSDEDGNSVTPDSATWTLTDSDGDVVNNRQDVNISSLSESIEILLQGADLTTGGRSLAELKFTISALYQSDLGSNLVLIQQAKIPVEAV